MNETQDRVRKSLFQRIEECKGKIRNFQDEIKALIVEISEIEEVIKKLTK